MKAPKRYLAVAITVLAATVCTGAAHARSRGIHTIRHVVIIIQENRSFDSYFGTFPGADGIPMRHGVPTVCVPDPLRHRCVRPFHDPRLVNDGGPHDQTAYATDFDGGRMDGFIRARESCTNALDPRDCIANLSVDMMGYHDRREIPNYWAYARHYVLQDHMFEPDASWSLPAHLYLVSEWSALCADGNPFSCTSNIEDPGLPTDIGPPHPAPQYSWTDLTYLLHRHHVSWGYYIKTGPEPDCETGAMFCQYHPQDPRTPGIWNPLPSFEDVQQDDQLGNIRDTSAFYSALRRDRLPAVSWVIPSGIVSEHPTSSIRTGQAYVTRLINAVGRSPAWKSTAIFLTWDDWGGFFDHVETTGNRRERVRVPRPRSGHQPVRPAPPDRPSAAQLRRLREVHRGRLPVLPAAESEDRRSPRPASGRPRARARAGGPPSGLRLRREAAAAADPAALSTLAQPVMTTAGGSEVSPTVADAGPGLWRSSWPAEDGGPQRRQVPAGASGLRVRPGETLRLAAWRDAFATTMVVLRDPGEVFVLRHTIGRRPFADDTTAWLELVDPLTLEPIARSTELPGGPFWPGGVAAHADGSLIVVHGRHCHRLSPGLDVVASRELPQPRPYNSFVVLPDGVVAMKDLDRGLREPSRMTLLDPETLEPVCADVYVPEPAIGRLSADGATLYVAGATTMWRYAWNGAGLERDERWQLRYHGGAGHGYAWDPVIAGGQLWALDNGAHDYATTMRAAARCAGPVRLVRVSLRDADDWEAVEVCGLARGAVSNPPLYDVERRIAIAYDSANGIVGAFRFGDALTPLWRRRLAHAGHMIQFPSTGQVILHDFRAPAVTASRGARAIGRRWAGPARSRMVRRAAARVCHDDVVVVDIETGAECARAPVPSMFQSVLFPAPGFARDLYWCTFSTLARLEVAGAR